MTECGLVYDTSTGAIERRLQADSIDTSVHETGSGLALAVYDAANVPASLEGKLVDTDTEDIVDDPDYADVVERDRVRELASVQRRHGQIQDEIDAGHIPSRSENANVDQVMTEWENRRDDLRGKIG